jgi:hypothetical protein
LLASSIAIPDATQFEQEVAEHRELPTVRDTIIANAISNRLCDSLTASDPEPKKSARQMVRDSGIAQLFRGTGMQIAEGSPILVRVRARTNGAVVRATVQF